MTSRGSLPPFTSSGEGDGEQAIEQHTPTKPKRITVRVRKKEWAMLLG